MKNLGTFLSEAKVRIRSPMEKHEKAIGVHVAKGLIDHHKEMHLDFAHRDYGESEKHMKPHHHGSVLKNALENAKDHSDSTEGGSGDPHIFHSSHFDRIKHHTIQHLQDRYDAHLKKHGTKGLPKDE